MFSLCFPWGVKDLIFFSGIRARSSCQKIFLHNLPQRSCGQIPQRIQVILYEQKNQLYLWKMKTVIFMAYNYLYLIIKNIIRKWLHTDIRYVMKKSFKIYCIIRNILSHASVLSYPMVHLKRNILNWSLMYLSWLKHYQTFFLLKKCN